MDLRYIVPCRVVDSQDKPISGLRIQALDQDPISPHDPLGEAAITNSAGMVEFRFLSSDFTEHEGEAGPDLYFKVYRGNTLLQYTLPRDINDNGVMRRFQPQRTPITIQVAKSYVVEGRVLRQNGVPAEEGLELFIYNLGFGGTSTLLGKTKTDANSYYVLAYDPGSAVINLQVRIKNPDNYEAEISLAKTKFNSDAHQVLNLVVPWVTFKAEYQRLAEDLIPHVEDMRNLAKARENAERQDLTVLNRATGWDARIIALAAKAASIYVQDVGLSQEALYGLFRAGLPTDKTKLGCINPQTVGEALLKARDAGIIELSDDEIKAATERFEAFANGTRLSITAPGSNTTYSEMLNTAEIGINLETEEERANLRARFAEVYLNHSGDPGQLWDKASEAGISDDDIKTLQLQGKLSYLTVNSKELTTRLHKVLGISDPAQLVDKDFYQAAKWREEVKAMSGGDAERLKGLIPPAYLGDTVEDRLSAYAEDMARKIRLSYSTQVIARMLETDTADGFKLGSARYDTSVFLKNAAAKGFKLGRTPVEAFLKSDPTTFSLSTSQTVSETVKRTVKTLTCVYQITPSNESMQVLLNLGFTSAHDVVAISQDDFLKRYGTKFPSQTEAELVYRKAKQVDAVTHNLFAIIKKVDSEAPVQVISAPLEEKTKVRNNLIKQFPDMESLFGSLDFCECEHCRSVLSPAAYFVDLLQFLDKNAEQAVAADWNYQMTNWPTEHGGAKYPFKNLEQEQHYLNLWKLKHPNQTPNTQKTPYEVLIERRPDLPHIPLTCENTHTALPYIDVVNEILEYFVANGMLGEKAARDTGSAETPDLLAEPANVIIEAYTKLQQGRYPLGLPFDLWLETVRRFCTQFETPLWQLLETFRPGDALFASNQNYDRSVIFAEALGLSTTEYSIFTDPNPLNKWYELYGYNSEAEATTVTRDADSGQRLDLNSAKALSRRLGVSYRELAELVQTGFVNPKLNSLVVLHKLNVRINDVLFYKNNKDFYTANKDLLGKKRNTLSAADQQRFDKLTEENWRTLTEIKAFEERLDEASAKFASSGFDARAWLNDAFSKNAFDGILLLQDPNSGCNFDETTLGCVGSSPTDSLAMALLKINLFVRLWRKLGWSIEETDRALLAFIPKDTPYVKENVSKSPLKTALLYLAHFKALDERLRLGRGSRSKLITFWSELAVNGKKPLYSQLFLTHNVLKNDSVFDDPWGNYLSSTGLATLAQSHWYDASLQNVPPGNKIDPTAFSAHPKITFHYDQLLQVQSLSYQGVLADTAKASLLSLSPSPALPQLLDEVQSKAREFTRLKGHLGSLQGALGLTADEINHILPDAGLSTDSNLSLANVSVLYRYGLLAKALKISICDLISLKQLSGLDPFKALSNKEITGLSEDYPFTCTLAFVELAEAIKESGLKIEDLDFLLRHRFDPTGKYAPRREAVLDLIKNLAEGVSVLQAEHAIPGDTTTLDEEFLRQKLGLILPANILERFIAMLNGTVEFTATKASVPVGSKLVQETFVVEPAIREVSYSETREVQTLTFKGVLFDTEKAQLKDSFASATFASLLDTLQTLQRDFFEQNLRRFFDEFNEIFSIGPWGLSPNEKLQRLLWAIGPNLALLKPSILTETVLRKNLGLVLPADVAATFAQMLDGTISYTAVKVGVEPENKLDPGTFTETNLALSYDETKKEQSITYTGVLLESESKALKTEHTSPLFGELLDNILKQGIGFFDQNLLGFFARSDFGVLFLPSGLSEAEKALRTQARNKKLAQAFLLYVLAVDKSLWEGDSLKQILKAVFSDQVIETFLKMWSGDIEYVAVKENVSTAEKLDPAVISEPQITLNYDAATKQQTLSFKGVLLRTESAELKSKYRVALFADLLTDIEGQAREFYLANLQGVFSQSAFNQLFTVLPQGLNPSLKQKLMGQKHTRWARTLLPFLQQQLIRQFVLQTLTAQLGTDPGLLEALLTNPLLLSDPKPLLEAFAATAETGLTATFYGSTNLSGAPFSTKLFSDADSSLQDKAGTALKPSGANSATFEGCLVVKTPGAYRFFAELDKKGAQVELAFEHLSEPLINEVAGSDKAEISQYIELEPGRPYPFSMKAKNLGGGNARLTVQGETLPKGALAQLTLYPKENVDRAEHAQILLKKALQLIQGLNLSEREVSYLATHSADFDGFNLSKLPTSEGESGLQDARLLFKQFLRLAGYARLKQDLAGSTDGLIEVFEAATLDKAYSLIAKLTRRDQGAVRAAAEVLFTSPSFSSELPLKRLWAALQVVERFGVPAASVAGWTKIVRGPAMPDGGFAIAKNLRESIKARFEPETWQRMVRPIFDKLRQLQRDSLVAYVMNKYGFQRLEQLYEYFLIDPGMEPVVQTSRIRLAISSVQLFIQRCLLNLEPMVHPSVINTRQWEWMKRYRVWEANRKIFLFPENWLEPEFRDDKTHLFRELEGSLLQGDVSEDLVEDAFLNYLKRLDELARLDIVGMHCEVKKEVALNTVHVIGRTFNKPYKYFYRRYVHQMWTHWEPVTAEIEGEHIAPVVWRDRLYLFWVTFLDKPDTNANVVNVKENPGDPNSKNKRMDDMAMSDVVSSVAPLAATKVIEAHLHWSEYFKGEWSTSESNGFNIPEELKVKATVPLNFSDKSIFIHVSKDSPDDEGQDKGVFIHLGLGAINQSFYLAGRNSVPVSAGYQAPPEMPYSKKKVAATRYTGEGALNVTFTERVIKEDGVTQAPKSVVSGILEKGGSYTLLPADNTVKRGNPEFGHLITPVFYQDNANTLFMEPELDETRIEEWQEWVTRAPEHDPGWAKIDWLKDLVLKSVIPEFKPSILVDPEDPVWSNPVDLEVTFKVNEETDWLANSITVIQFDDQLIGQMGRTDLVIQSKAEAAVTMTTGGVPMDAFSGSEVPSGSTVVAVSGAAVNQLVLTNTTGGISIVGNSGLNSALIGNLNMTGSVANKIG